MPAYLPYLIFYFLAFFQWRHLHSIVLFGRTKICSSLCINAWDFPKSMRYLHYYKEAIFKRLLNFCFYFMHWYTLQIRISQKWIDRKNKFLYCKLHGHLRFLRRWALSQKLLFLDIKFQPIFLKTFCFVVIQGVLFSRKNTPCYTYDFLREKLYRTY